jgi:hypothetical protein
MRGLRGTKGAERGAEPRSEGPDRAPSAARPGPLWSLLAFRLPGENAAGARGSYFGLPDTTPRATPMNVQQSAEEPSARSPEEVQRIAAQGFAGSSQELPHFQTIQRAFGDHDVSDVEAHVGGPAKEAGRAMGARAFAADRRVAFAEPPTLHTVAHEAAHVVQQRGPLRLEGGVGVRGDRYERHADAVAEAVVAGGSAATLLDNVASPEIAGERGSSMVVQRLSAKFKPLADRIADVRKTGYTWWHLPTLEKMLALAEAVDASDVAATRKAVAEFLKQVSTDPLDPATAVILNDVPLTLVSRVFLLGLPAESRELQNHFYGPDGSYKYEQASTRGGFANAFAVWSQIVEDAVTGSHPTDPAKAEAGIDHILLAVDGVCRALLALDPAQVEKDQKASRASVSSLDPYDWNRNPDQTIGGHFSHLLTLIPPLVAGIQVAFQVLMDTAAADLESGKGGAALAKARSVLDDKLVKAFDPPKLKHLLLSAAVDITRSDFESRTKKHLDYFNKGRRTPFVEIEAYDNDPSNTYFSEKQLSVRRIIEIRDAQIVLLERLHGLRKDKSGKVTGESSENAAAIKSAGGLKLHDNDSWRTFLLEKFRASRKRLGNDWDALSATINLLGDYLSAFTIHAPYNIDEFGDNYLTRTFPRALTGQLIHDCGVYALRVAYALSLVRKELGLIFRAVAMPLHVGLIIAYDDVMKGAFFLNNEQFTPVPPQQMKRFAKTWTEVDESGAQRAAPVALDEKQFLGEIAAATFVERTDMPFRIEDVPEVGDVKDPRRRHAILWDFYHQKITGSRHHPLPVTAPIKDEPQPELRYLVLLERGRDFYNRSLVPFWRFANQVFTTQKASLVAAAKDLATPAKKGAAEKVLAAHKKQLVDAATALQVWDTLDQLNKARDEVSAFLTANPKAAARTSRIAHAARIGITSDRELEIDRYLGPSVNAVALVEGVAMQGVPGLVVPTWQSEEELPRPAD